MYTNKELIPKMVMLKPGSTWWIYLAKATGSLVLFGSILSIVEIDKPWSMQLSIQVLATTVIVGTVAFAVGIYSKQQLSVKAQKEFYLKQLSAREYEVAMLLFTSLSNKEICAKLFIENNTLKTHIRHIFKKTNCTSREAFIERFQ